MAKEPQKRDVSDEQIEQERDKGLARLMRMPPRPHKDEARRRRKRRTPPEKEDGGAGR